MNTIERAMKQTTGLSSESLSPSVLPALQKHESVSLTSPSSQMVEPDWNHLRRLGMLIPTGGETELDQFYRFIKRPLLNTAFAQERRANLIMTTSAVPREGKTFTAVNLAVSIARELDSTVLLVDADVASRSASRLLGVHDRRGLMDLLADDTCAIADVMVRTGMERLRIIPAGNMARGINSDELLASRRMREIVGELARRYPDRIVLFDAPPLLATSQASVLAELMSQVVLVVAAGRTLQSQVVEAIDTIKPGPHVGIILNMAADSLARDGYGRPYK